MLALMLKGIFFQSLSNVNLSRPSLATKSFWTKKSKVIRDEAPGSSGLAENLGPKEYVVEVAAPAALLSNTVSLFFSLATDGFRISGLGRETFMFSPASMVLSAAPEPEPSSSSMPVPAVRVMNGSEVAATPAAVTMAVAPTSTSSPIRNLLASAANIKVSFFQSQPATKQLRIVFLGQATFLTDTPGIKKIADDFVIQSPIVVFQGGANEPGTQFHLVIKMRQGGRRVKQVLRAQP